MHSQCLPGSNVLHLRLGVLAVTAMVHVRAVVVTDIKVHKADITIPEQFQQYPDVYTPYVQAGFILVAVLNATVAKDVPAMSTDLTSVISVRSADNKVSQIPTGQMHCILAIRVA